MSQIDNISDIDFFVAEQIKQYNKIPDDDPERFVQAAPPQPDQPEPEKTSTTSNIFKKAAITALTIGATAIAGNAVRKQFFSPSNLNMGRVGREQVIIDDFDNTDLLGKPLDRPPSMRPMPPTMRPMPPTMRPMPQITRPPEYPSDVRQQFISFPPPIGRPVSEQTYKPIPKTLYPRGP
jgi:hypothetical protein